MPTTSPSPTRARRGRLLVECLVAMLLINATALVVVSLARTASWSAQRARLTSSAWALATQQVESSPDSACTTAAGVDATPSLTSVWSDQASGGFVTREVSVTSTPSPLVGRPLQLSLQAAWWCR